MKTIAVECPSCRLIEPVTAACLLVEVGQAPNEEKTSGTTVSWICDTCMELVALPVELTALLALLAAGATILDSDLDDARPAYPESTVDGSPFTADDLLEFHQLLGDDLWLTEELASDGYGPAAPGSGQ